MDLQRLQNSVLVSKLERRYYNLGSRERFAVKLLLVFMLLVVVYSALVVPAANYRRDAENHYRSSLDKLQWMQTNQSLVTASARQRSARDPGQSLLGIANSSSKGFQLSFKRYEPVGDSGLSLWLDQVGFNNLVRWLERLDKRYGIQVQEIAVERQQEDGLVNVRLVLQG